MQSVGTFFGGHELNRNHFFDPPCETWQQMKRCSMRGRPFLSKWPLPRNRNRNRNHTPSLPSSAQQTKIEPTPVFFWGNNRFILTSISFLKEQFGVVCYLHRSLVPLLHTLLHPLVHSWAHVDTVVVLIVLTGIEYCWETLQFFARNKCMVLTRS